jgi:nucleoside-diphosphate-sugar epimerase
MRVFITGATGVVGRRLVPLLVGAGHAVLGVGRSAAARAEIERLGAKSLGVDLFDRDAVLRAVAGNDAVVNLATHIPRSTAQMLMPWAWRENDRLRRQASATLVDCSIAAGVSRYIQESFAPVYPDRGDRWIDETTALSPVLYNRTIADAEAAAQRFAGAGRNRIVLRFGAFYGPDATQTAELINWVKRGWAPLPGPPNAYISSLSHADAATAVAAALNVPDGIYNVVDDEPVTHAEFVASLAEALHVGAPRLPPAWFASLFGSLGKMAARSVRVSNRKLKSESGWAPRYRSVREGWPAVIAQMAGDRTRTAAV